MTTVLVSGASGIVGYGILRSLRQPGLSLQLVGTTIYTDSVAQAFSDIFERAPLTGSAAYLPWLEGIIATHHVDLLIPGFEADVYAWVEQVDAIAAAGAKVVLNDPGLIALCRDKWTFYQRLSAIDTRYVIESALTPDFDTLADRFGLPFLLKPRVGFGARGIVRVDSAATFQAHQADVGPRLMAQPIVGTDDEEFSASAFCDGLGRCLTSMTLRRRLSRDGFTDRAEVVQELDVDKALSVLAAHFKPIGPTNFQFRRHHGLLKLLEINPRISSATSIRTAFGYNESRMAVEWYLEGRVPQPPVVRRGRAVRYVEDVIFDT